MYNKENDVLLYISIVYFLLLRIHSTILIMKQKMKFDEIIKG